MTKNEMAQAAGLGKSVESLRLEVRRELSQIRAALSLMITQAEEDIKDIRNDLTELQHTVKDLKGPSIDEYYPD